MLESNSEYIIKSVARLCNSYKLNSLNDLKEGLQYHDLSSTDLLRVCLLFIEQEWLQNWKKEDRKEIVVDFYKSNFLKIVFVLLSEPSLKKKSKRIASVFMQVLHRIDLSDSSEIELDKLIETTSTLIDKTLLPDFIYELERIEKFQNKKCDNYYSYNGKLKDYGDRKKQLLKRFSVRLVNNINILIQKLNLLKEKDQHNYLKIRNEEKRYIIRCEIINFLHPEQELVKLCLHLLLKRYSDIEDDIVAITTSVLEPEHLDELRLIAQHSSEDDEVQLRAKVILAHIEEAFPTELVPQGEFTSTSHAIAYYNEVITSRGRAFRGRTWIEDETVELSLHGSLKKADEQFSNFFTTNYGKQEPALTERLLIYLEQEFKLLQSFLNNWFNQSSNKAIQVDLSYRDTQRREKEWNADIAFTLECEIESKFKKNHAILVQCKKMIFSSASKKFQNSWTIDVNQCHDLIGKSPFSYYFLFGPRDYPTVQTLIVPATTIRGITAATGRKSVSLDKVRPNSRTLADFMLYDFIGCWIGDESSSVIDYTKGNNVEDGLPARYIVNVSIRHVDRLER